MTTLRVLIVKTGETVAPLRARRGDFDDWFRAGLGLDRAQAPTVQVYLGEPLPSATDVPAVIVTGSPAMVTDEAEWSLATERWLADLVEREVPLLGVCYGHQQLARALGGTADFAPNGLEIGTVRVTLTSEGRADPLFAGLPDELITQAAHHQSATVLPPNARLLAGNAHDPFQAFAVGPRAWAVQFHPEFDADIARGYLSARAEAIRKAGRDPEALAQVAHDSDHGHRILRNFLALAEG